jgi:hypothetical protein
MHARSVQGATGPVRRNRGRPLAVVYVLLAAGPLAGCGSGRTPTVTRTNTVVVSTSRQTSASSGFAQSDEGGFGLACLNDGNIRRLAHDTQTRICRCALRAVEAQSSPAEFAQVVADWRSTGSGTSRLAPHLAISACIQKDTGAAPSSSTTSTAAPTLTSSSPPPLPAVSCSAPGLGEGHTPVQFNATGVGCADGTRLLTTILSSLYTGCHLIDGQPTAPCVIAGLTCTVESADSAPGSPVQCVGSGETIRFSLPG